MMGVLDIVQRLINKVIRMFLKILLWSATSVIVIYFSINLLYFVSINSSPSSIIHPSSESKRIPVKNFKVSIQGNGNKEELISLLESFAASNNMSTKRGGNFRAEEFYFGMTSDVFSVKLVKLKSWENYIKVMLYEREKGLSDNEKIKIDSFEESLKNLFLHNGYLIR